MEMVHFIPTGHRRLAVLAAQADSGTVLISGASGTGKGAIARWIHKNSPRATKTFLEAALDQPIAPQILLAQGGTLLISEIAELPRAEQKTLLEYLETKSIPHPDPEQTNLKMIVHTRIMATTGHLLTARAQAGLFNGELLEKLSVFRIDMPALKSRKEEFEDIVLGILGEITRELHKEHLRTFTPDAWKRLRDYEWPGNLRELRNVLRATVMSATDDPISVQDFPEFGHDRIDFHATREAFERTYLLELLKTFDYQLDKTSLATRMERKTLIEKIKKYGIDVQLGSP